MSELPPGPRAPATVNTARLLRRPLESLLGWQRRYGDVFTVRYLIFGLRVSRRRHHQGSSAAKTRL